MCMWMTSTHWDDIIRVLLRADCENKQETQCSGDDIMKTLIEKILNEYIEAKRKPFAGHPMGTFFRNDIPREIYSTGLVNTQDYLVTGSVGQGNWAAVPWVCIFDRKITTSATKGVYIVYLLNRDTVDFLEKKRVPNNGLVPQYYVENSHEAIIPPRPLYAGTRRNGQTSQPS